MTSGMTSTRPRAVWQCPCTGPIPEVSRMLSQARRRSKPLHSNPLSCPWNIPTGSTSTVSSPPIASHDAFAISSAFHSGLRGLAAGQRFEAVAPDGAADAAVDRRHEKCCATASMPAWRMCGLAGKRRIIIAPVGATAQTRTRPRRARLAKSGSAGKNRCKHTAARKGESCSWKCVPVRQGSKGRP